jgi:SAM-dependent methyltransferase
MNVNHWYDGLFYDLFIAPHQDRAYTYVRDLIEEGSTVLDVGCATGRLAFQLAKKCGTVDAIDPSARNIDIARGKLERHPAGNVRFHHADALSFLERGGGRFDYATISYMIHEIEENEREKVLRSIAAAANKIILVDYPVPGPGGFANMLNTAVEFAAGREHYRNFRSFLAGNGLRGVVAQARLAILNESRDNLSSAHILVAARKVK